MAPANRINNCVFRPRGRIYSNGMPNSISQHHAEPAKEKKKCFFNGDPSCGSLGWAETLGGLREMRCSRGRPASTHARTADGPVFRLAACVPSRSPPAPPPRRPFLPGPEHPCVSLLAWGRLRGSPVLGTILRGHREKAQGLCHQQEPKASLPSSYRPSKLRLSLCILLLYLHST